MTNLSLQQNKQMYIPTVSPDEAPAYFMAFSTKEEYLQRRAEWRALYAYLSTAIRSNKNRFRANASWEAKIAYRMAKAEGLQPSAFFFRRCTNQEVNDKYAARVKMATRNIPPQMDTMDFDPTDLLKIREAMKLEAGAQRARDRELFRA